MLPLLNPNPSGLCYTEPVVDLTGTQSPLPGYPHKSHNNANNVPHHHHAMANNTFPVRNNNNSSGPFIDSQIQRMLNGSGAVSHPNNTFARNFVNNTNSIMNAPIPRERTTNENIHPNVMMIPETFHKPLPVPDNIVTNPSPSPPITQIQPQTQLQTQMMLSASSISQQSSLSHGTNESTNNDNVFVSTTTKTTKKKKNSSTTKTAADKKKNDSKKKKEKKEKKKTTSSQSISSSSSSSSSSVPVSNTSTISKTKAEAEAEAEAEIGKSSPSPSPASSQSDKNTSASTTKKKEKKKSTKTDNTETPAKTTSKTATSNKKATTSSKKKTSAKATKPKAAKSKGTGGKGNKPLLSAIQKKWHEAAVAMNDGKTDVKIVFKKSEAKKVIYEMLRDEFRPMTITGIYNKLKATVPSPVLKTCIDEMVEPDPEPEFDDINSGANENLKKIKKIQKQREKENNDNNEDDSALYKNSLQKKYGRSANGTLFFVNQSTLENKGNALPPHEQSERIGDYKKLEMDIESIQNQITHMKQDTTRLNSEPTNQEATTQITTLEQEISKIEEELQRAQKYLQNAQQKKLLEKNVAYMKDYWFKRKKKCVDFLSQMDDWTEGTISMKKCLKGDGQIEIESDESALKDAMEQYNMAPMKRRIGQPHLSMNNKRRALNNQSGIKPSFVGLRLLKKGDTERVYFNDSKK